MGKPWIRLRRRRQWGNPYHRAVGDPGPFGYGMHASIERHGPDRFERRVQRRRALRRQVRFAAWIAGSLLLVWFVVESVRGLRLF